MVEETTEWCALLSQNEEWFQAPWMAQSLFLPVGQSLPGEPSPLDMLAEQADAHTAQFTAGVDLSDQARSVVPAAIEEDAERYLDLLGDYHGRREEWFEAHHDDPNFADSSEQVTAPLSEAEQSEIEGLAPIVFYDLCE